MTNKLSLPSERLSDTSMLWMSVLGVAICAFGALLEVFRSACPEPSALSKYLFCEPQLRSLEQGFSILTLALGSAMIGAGISQLASNRKARELLTEVSDALQRTVAQPAVYSSPEKLEHFRKVYYCYHSTQQGKKRLWRSMKLDFTSKPAINRLICDPDLIDESGNVDTNYLVEAFVRGAHLVLIFLPKHSEPKFVRIFPMAGFRFNGVMWGFSTHMDFDNGRGTWRTILSEGPIGGIASSTFITDDERISLLDREWENLCGDWYDDMPRRSKIDA